MEKNSQDKKNYMHKEHFFSKAEKVVINSKLRSILDYGLPLYMGEPEQVKQRLEAAYMMVNRIIQGGLNFKVNKVKIGEEIKVNLPHQHIHKTALYTCINTSITKNANPW